MSDFTFQVTVTVKADTMAEAKANMAEVLNRKFCEDVSDGAPYPNGSLLYWDWYHRENRE